MAGCAAEIPVFVQARMTSQRLPGKVMLDVAGRPLLAYLMERLAHCHRVSTVIVLTSRDASDDPVADFCQQRALKCFRELLYPYGGSAMRVSAAFHRLPTHREF